MILLFVIVCALFILAFSAMMQPGRAKATAAARATGQQRPRENRAQTANERSAPPDQEGTTAGSPGQQDPPRPNASRNSASNEGRPHAATNHARPDPPRRTATARRKTADGKNGKLCTAPARRNYPRIPRPGWTQNNKPEAPKTRQNPRISHGSAPKNRRIPSRFLHFLSRFSNFSRFFLDFLPSRFRHRLDFSPFSPPICRKFLDFSAPILDFLHFSHRPGVPKFLQFSPIPQILPIFLDFSRPVRLAIFSILCYNIFQQILVVSAQIPQTPDMVTMHKFISVVLAVL